MEMIKNFAKSESGAVTVDWVVLTAAIVGLGLAVSDTDGSMNATLSASFAAGAATTVNVYVAMDEAQADETAYGIGVVHNMGGGVSLRGGVAGLHGTTRADLGVNFTF